MNNNEVHAFEVGVRGAPWPPTVINHRTAGKAKSAYLLDVLDAGWDVKFIDLTVRKLRPNAMSSREFVQVAQYRGLPDARCGQRVKVGNSFGVIVGYNASANFDVLFDDDDPQYPGLTLNVHPNSCEFEKAEENDSARRI